MLKSDELLTPTSCLNKASDEEPLFVLRANDPSAPGTVRSWASYYFNRKKMAGQWDDKTQNKYYEAMALADQMKKWKKAQGGSRSPCEHPIRNAAYTADGRYMRAWCGACGATVPLPAEGKSESDGTR